MSKHADWVSYLVLAIWSMIIFFLLISDSERIDDLENRLSIVENVLNIGE